MLFISKIVLQFVIVEEAPSFLWIQDNCMRPAVSAVEWTVLPQLATCLYCITRFLCSLQCSEVCRRGRSAHRNVTFVVATLRAALGPTHGLKAAASTLSRRNVDAPARLGRRARVMVGAIAGATADDSPEPAPQKKPVRR